MEHWEKKANGWVFLSHSSADYEDVKIVRNYLEESGFSALMFYLKCLEDEDKREEAQKLIEWEIEKRNIFVLCDSSDAKLSPWVQDEVKHVKKFPEKIYVEIDMDKLKYEKCTQLSKLDNLMKKSTLFFSYSSEDKEFVMKVYEYLKSEGFKIWIDNHEIRIGDNITQQINDALIDATKNGYILFFMSKNFMASPWSKQELFVSLSLNATILPIIVDDVDIMKEFPLLSDKKILYMNMKNFDGRKKELLVVIKRLGN